jgi:hypothetical protein
MKTARLAPALILLATFVVAPAGPPWPRPRRHLPPSRPRLRRRQSASPLQPAAPVRPTAAAPAADPMEQLRRRLAERLQNQKSGSRSPPSHPRSRPAGGGQAGQGPRACTGGQLPRQNRRQPPAAPIATLRPLQRRRRHTAAARRQTTPSHQLKGWCRWRRTWSRRPCTAHRPPAPPHVARCRRRRQRPCTAARLSPPHAPGPPPSRPPPMAAMPTGTTPARPARRPGAA